MNRASVMIYSCDKYSDVWGPFFTLFFRYWQCPYPVYLATETKQCLLPGVITINSQCDTWTERIREAVKQIPTEYVIAMCEDMFFRRPVNQSIIDKCLKAMEKAPDAASFNFECDRKNTKHTIYADFGLKTADAEFKKSCQPSLWRRSIFEELLDVKMDAWEWESSETDGKYEFYVYTGPEEDAAFEYGYHNGEWFGIQKGKWVESDIKPLFEKERITIDLSIRGTI